MLIFRSGRGDAWFIFASTAHELFIFSKECFFLTVVSQSRSFGPVLVNLILLGHTLKFKDLRLSILLLRLFTKGSWLLKVIGLFNPTWPKSLVILLKISLFFPGINIWSERYGSLRPVRTLIHRFIFWFIMHARQPFQLLKILHQLVPLILWQPDWWQVLVEAILALYVHLSLLPWLLGWDSKETVRRSTAFIRGPHCALLILVVWPVVQRFEEVEQLIVRRVLY